MFNLPTEVMKPGVGFKAAALTDCDQYGSGPTVLWSRDDPLTERSQAALALGLPLRSLGPAGGRPGGGPTRCEAGPTVRPTPRLISKNYLPVMCRKFEIPKLQKYYQTIIKQIPKQYFPPKITKLLLPNYQNITSKLPKYYKKILPVRGTTI
jgi:hypothetical protein